MSSICLVPSWILPRISFCFRGYRRSFLSTRRSMSRMWNIRYLLLSFPFPSLPTCSWRFRWPCSWTTRRVDSPLSSPIGIVSSSFHTRLALCIWRLSPFWIRSCLYPYCSRIACSSCHGMLLSVAGNSIWPLIPQNGSRLCYLRICVRRVALLPRRYLCNSRSRCLSFRSWLWSNNTWLCRSQNMWIHGWFCSICGRVCQCSCWRVFFAFPSSKLSNTYSMNSLNVSGLSVFFVAILYLIVVSMFSSSTRYEIKFEE